MINSRFLDTQSSRDEFVELIEFIEFFEFIRLLSQQPRPLAFNLVPFSFSLGL
jgi:hypothetical protein